MTPGKIKSPSPNGPALDILVLSSYAQQSPLIDYVDIFSLTRVLNFGLNLYLHPYFVHASSVGSGVWAFGQAHIRPPCSAM